MAIVKEFTARNGAHVIVRDDCYRDASAEELARRYEEIRQAIIFAELRAAEVRNSSRATPQSGSATSPRNDPEDRRGAAAACAKAQRRQCVKRKEREGHELQGRG